MSEIERLRGLVAGAQDLPWRWVHDSGSTMLWTSEPVGGPGHILTPHVCEPCDKNGRPCLGPSEANAALILAVNALPALLDVAEAARELLVEAEVIRSHARSLKPHPDTVSDLRAAFDRLDRT